MSVKNVKHGFCIFEAKPNAAGATTKGKPAGMMGVTIVFLGPRTKKTNLLYAVLLPWWTPNMFADKTTHSDLRLRMPTATQLIMRSKVFVCLVCLLKPWNLPIYCIRKPIQWPHSYLQLSGSNKGVIPSGVLAWSSGTPLGKEPQWHALGQIQKTLDTAATMGESSSQVTGRGMGWDTSPCRASWSVRRPRVPRSNPELELEVEKSSS